MGMFSASFVVNWSNQILKDNWNAFGCKVSEDLLLGTAKKIVDLGLRDLGYNYVILDDCWSVGRDEKGALKVDTTKFPSGMKHVGDQVSSRRQGLR